ncbi:hypothetical protein NL676_032329 [Syzygium grande]|nr:hypothetical protein NL676_032329 [Syzygium grande]
MDCLIMTNQSRRDDENVQSERQSSSYPYSFCIITIWSIVFSSDRHGDRGFRSSDESIYGNLLAGNELSTAAESKSIEEGDENRDVEHRSEASRGFLRNFVTIYFRFFFSSERADRVCTIVCSRRISHHVAITWPSNSEIQ